MRLGVGLGPFYVSGRLPRLGVARGMSAWIAWSFTMFFWMLKLFALMAWWMLKLTGIAAVWVVTTAPVVIRAVKARRASGGPPAPGV